MKSSLIPCCLLALLSLGRTPAQSPAPTALRAGFVPGADVMVHINMVAMNQTPFSKAVEAQQSPEAKAKAAEAQEKFTAATGLREEDLLVAVASFDFDSVDLANMSGKQLDQAMLVIALQTAKPLTLDQVKAGLIAMFGEDMEQSTMMSMGQVGDVPALVLGPKEVDENGPKAGYAALDAQGTTLVLGFNPVAVEEAIGRIEAGSTASPTPAMKDALQHLGPHQFRVAVVLPPSVKQMIQDQVQAAQADDPMAAGMMMPFAKLSGVLVGATADRNLDLTLSVNLGDANAPAQAMGMLQGMAMPMIMMASQGQISPEAAQKIKFATKGDNLDISISLSPEDLKPAEQGNADPFGGMMPMPE